MQKIFDFLVVDLYVAAKIGSLGVEDLGSGVDDGCSCQV